MNIDKAFSVDNGITIDEENGGPFYTGGTASPIGLDLPVETFYSQTTPTGILIWRKFNTGVNDWRQLSAEDIPYDSTGTDVAATNVQDAITNLGNRNFGKDAVNSLTQLNDSTTGTTWKLYADLTLNVSEVTGTNTYRINADFLWGHNSSSNDVRARVSVDGAVRKELRIEPKDQGNDQRIQNNLMFYINDLSLGDHLIELEYRPASSNRVSQMYRADLEAWRTK